MPLELLKSKTGRTLIESHRGVENGDVPENSWSAIQPYREQEEHDNENGDVDMFFEPVIH